MDIAYTEYTQMISMWIESKQYAELSLSYSKATAFFCSSNVFRTEVDYDSKRSKKCCNGSCAGDSLFVYKREKSKLIIY